MINSDEGEIMRYGVNLFKEDFSEEDYEKILIETTKIIEDGKDREEIGIAYYNRGLAYYSRHQEEKAIPDFTNAIEIMPNFADVYFMRAASYFMFYEHEKALIDAKKALQLNKTDLQCLNFIEELKKKLPIKILKKDFYEDEIPNETTIKAKEEKELFSFDSVEEMIEDALKEPD